MRIHKRRVRRQTDGNLSVATHYFELTKSSRGSLSSFYLRFGSALVTSSITFQTTNLEEVESNSSTTGDWYTETSVTIANAAASAAGTTYHVGNMGALRSRLVFVVTTAGPVDIATCEQE